MTVTYKKDNHFFFHSTTGKKNGNENELVNSISLFFCIHERKRKPKNKNINVRATNRKSVTAQSPCLENS